MQSKPKKPGSKKPAKGKAAKAPGNEATQDAGKLSVEHRIKALKKIIKQLTHDKNSSQ